MKVIIRADGSERVGLGHVGRCLALAESLRKRGAEVSFLCDAEARLGIGMINRAGLTVHTNESAIVGADWLVVDHYGLDAAWEEKSRDRARVLVIDDLADRPHSCDLLLDPGRAPRQMGAYDHLLPTGLPRLAGPRFALLRREFRSVRKRHAPHVPPRVLVFFGSVDRGGLTEQTVDALQGLKDVIEIHAVVTSANPRQTEIAARDDVIVHEEVNDMAELLSSMDLAVGAGGVALWERCCVGLPSVVMATNDNQRPALALAEAAGAVKVINLMELKNTLPSLLAPLLDDQQERQDMIRASQNLVDGRGADRVAALMGEVILRKTTFADARRLWVWANDPDVRKMAFTTDPIPWDGHVIWLKKKLSDPSALMFVAENKSGPMGQVRFDYDPQEQAAMIDISLAQEARGQGWGVEVLLKSILIYLADRPETRVAAWVKKENVASYNLFLNAGFIQDQQSSGAVRLSFSGG
ncbi:MAG: UDP-2,4-diacetamido-2,4,6-trideoxy-beta-L-altropyranose hydrolase [Alphaproteobacteria bacterium RIFOXYD12_FULL_60_8]|nr:MAG: UDP-2,4-diacetamido-2,4,6-trideoxy-beta-L-altropyranose hydrolase [Alphaproteobacteria bacterium RIFOXYD12_FULL_60_8]